MSVAPHKTVPFTDFRRNLGTHVDWVRGEGGRIWLARHGRCHVALVPMHQCEMLERFESRSLAQERRRMEDAHRRWRAAVGEPEDARAPFDWGKFADGVW